MLGAGVIMKFLKTIFNTFLKKSEHGVSSQEEEIFLNSTVVHNRLFYIDEIDSLNLKATPIFEPEETNLCIKLINKGDICLDIGANIGYYTILFSDKVGESGKVIAFEPDNTNYLILEKNCHKEINNNIVLLYKNALSDNNKKEFLYKSKDNHGMHRLYPSVCCSEDKIEVSVISGDSLNIGSVDFIKIDIEGYEYLALKGLSETIKKSNNIKILSEFSPLSVLEAGFSTQSLLDMMFSFGLAPIEYKDGKWDQASPDDLITAAKVADTINIKKLKNELKSKTNLEIANLASEALIQAKYPRPLLENILWVPPYEVMKVINTINT